MTTEKDETMLIVDDDPLMVATMQAALNCEGVPYQTARNVASARQLIATEDFGVMLLDVGLPDGSGLDLLDEIHRAHPDAAVVMTTGVDDVDTGRAALERGAVGYLVKPFSINELRIHIAAARRWRANASRAEADDPLAPVRAALSRAGERAVAIAIDLELPLVSALWGTSATRHLTEQARARLEASALPIEATLVTGDELVAVAHRARTTERVIGEVLWRLLHEPYQFGDSHAMIRPAIGMAPADIDNDDSPFLRARAAALQVRLDRGSGWGVYSNSTRDFVIDRVELAADLKTAIEEGGLYLAYQPQIDLRTNEVHGVEALVRWQHPKRGQLTPATFIPIAEQHGLIEPLGEWVLRQACHDVAELRDMHRAPVHILSVNVSPYQLTDEAFTQVVTSALSESGLSPEVLCLEVTESVALEHSPRIIEQLNQLARLGVGLSVDDLGVGYASFGRLADGPWTQVKIDRSLVSRLGDTAAQTVTQAIIKLGEELGVEVVAEGIENAAQADRLRGLGCVFAQGFHYGRPVRIEALARSATRVRRI